jgi:hypothetical protein
LPPLIQPGRGHFGNTACGDPGAQSARVIQGSVGGVGAVTAWTSSPSLLSGAPFFFVYRFAAARKISP